MAETAQTVPREDVAQKDTLSTIDDLLLLFYHIIGVYEWVHEDSDGCEVSGIAAALRGSFALLIREEYMQTLQNSIEQQKPWDAEGISRRAWYYRQESAAPTRVGTDPVQSTLPQKEQAHD